MTRVIVKEVIGRRTLEPGGSSRAAAVLLAKRGLQATSFSDVLERSGAPRGSIYHHFPEGKDELVDAAIGAGRRRAPSWIGRRPAARRGRRRLVFLTSGAQVLDAIELRGRVRGPGGHGRRRTHPSC